MFFLLQSSPWRRTRKRLERKSIRKKVLSSVMHVRKSSRRGEFSVEARSINRWINSMVCETVMVSDKSSALFFVDVDRLSISSTSSTFAALSSWFCIIPKSESIGGETGTTGSPASRAPPRKSISGTTPQPNTKLHRLWKVAITQIAWTNSDFDQLSFPFTKTYAQEKGSESWRHYWILHN